MPEACAVHYVHQDIQLYFRTGAKPVDLVLAADVREVLLSIGRRSMPNLRMPHRHKRLH